MADIYEGLFSAAPTTGEYYGDLPSSGNPFVRDSQQKYENNFVDFGRK